MARGTHTLMARGGYRSETRHNPLPFELGMRLRVPRLLYFRRNDQSGYEYSHH